MRAALVIVSLVFVIAVVGKDIDNFKKNGDTYKNNMDKVSKHNKDAKSTYVQGSNDNADLTQEERDQQRSGKFDAKAAAKSASKLPQKVKGDEKEIAKSMSYVKKMSPIKKQGKCLAAHSMTVTAIFEFMARRYFNKNDSYSDQEVIDCDKYGSGCSGGHPFSVMIYANTSGLSAEDKYKFAAKNQTCKKGKLPKLFNLKNVMIGAAVLKGDEEALKSILYYYGPVGTCINTNMTSNGFDFYKSGVFSDTTCSSLPENCDHLVNVVGYGTDKTLGDFFTIRNNWGTAWGEKGFMRIKRGVNMCGIANFIYLPYLV